MVETLVARTMSSETFSPPRGVSGLASHGPYPLKFAVEDRRGVLREASNVRRTEEHFSVSCFFQPHQSGRGELVRLEGNSQENLEKAKVEIKALLTQEMDGVVKASLCPGGLWQKMWWAPEQF